MPAPDLKTLMDVEGQCDNGIAALIQSRTGIDSFPVFSGNEKTTPFVDVMFETLGTTGQTFPIDVGGAQHAIRNAWRYRLTLNIYTRRGGEDHDEIRARIREAMLYCRGSFTESVLPYHQLVSVEETGAPRSVLESDDFDASELTYEGLVAVRTNAWPSL